MAKRARILAGQTAAITGAGRGIGRATAQALTRQGVRVAIGDLDLEAARATAQELGPTAVALSLDVTDRDSFERFLDETEAQLGPIDVLINNAGIMQLGKFMDEDDATATRMIDINLHGVILGMKLGLARMVGRGSGHIVNISSQAGKFGAPGGATYSATKHAVVGLTEAVRGELRLMGMQDRVLLSYVMPFVVNTELGGGLGQARGLKNLQPSDVAEAIVDALQNGTVDVWVPKSSKRTNALGVLLPRRLAEGLGRAMKADRVLTEIDTQARAAYELRASASEPGLQAGSEQARIAEKTGS
ncbi:MAG TPA: SDR family oxidoreductase [Solirubrobacteraceae bacterium]|nr:SDR family oxidoreductase [Solirubrobacteraceae bacterium]